VGLTVGVDASRNRSGGAQAHLLGLLTQADPRQSGIDRVHLWAYRELMDKVPDQPWLRKHVPAALDGPLLRQMWWQYRHLSREAETLGCQVMFNTDAGSVCYFQPGVTLSQDMLSFEPGEMRRFGLSIARLRLVLLFFIQRRSLRRADTAVFLTHHAGKVIQKVTGKLRRPIVIHHGVGDEFRAAGNRRSDAFGIQEPIHAIYVSNAALYKHQWHVVRAIARLRKSGFIVRLTLVGGGKGRAQRMLDEEIRLSDPAGTFVEQTPFMAHGRIPAFLTAADIFIFASSCENMPVTLLEAMATGLPIACSNRGPMPEILENAGVYFDPEDPVSIAEAVKTLLEDSDLRRELGTRARQLSGQYTWRRCADETWKVLAHAASRNCA
jgi:glycosyltransferase involved in cell wall biosynthesis